MQKYKTLWVIGLFGVMVTGIAKAQPLPDRRPLSGRVTDASGKPLAGVTITLSKLNDAGGSAFWGAVVVTNAQGNYSFPEAEEDSYRISAELPHYDSVQDQTFVLGPSSATWSATLSRLADMNLRFFKPDGSVLSSSPVILRLERNDSTSQPLIRKTKADGTLSETIVDQKQAHYRIQALVPGVGYALLPDVNLLYEADPHVIEVHLQQGGTLRFSARETNADGGDKPLGGAMLSLGSTVQVTAAQRAAGQISRSNEANLQNLYNGTGTNGGGVTRDGDGLLDITDLPPGSYTARLLAPGYPPSAWQNVDVKAGETTTLNFTFTSRHPMSSLDVTLQDKSGQPVSGDWDLQMRLLSGSLVLDEPGTPPGAPNMPTDVGLLSGNLLRRVHSDEKGHFTLYPLQAGKWRIVMFPARNDGGRGERGNTYQRDVDVTATGGNLMVVVTPPKR